MVADDTGEVRTARPIDVLSSKLGVVEVGSKQRFYCSVQGVGVVFEEAKLSTPVSKGLQLFVDEKSWLWIGAAGDKHISEILGREMLTYHNELCRTCQLRSS